MTCVSRALVPQPVWQKPVLTLRDPVSVLHIGGKAASASSPGHGFVHPGGRGSFQALQRCHLLTEGGGSHSGLQSGHGGCSQDTGVQSGHGGCTPPWLSSDSTALVHVCVTQAMPRASAPVRNIPCLAGSCSVAVSPPQLNTSLKVVSLQPSLRCSILDSNEIEMHSYALPEHQGGKFHLPPASLRTTSQLPT